MMIILLTCTQVIAKTIDLNLGNDSYFKIGTKYIPFYTFLKFDKTKESLYFASQLHSSAYLGLNVGFIHGLNGATILSKKLDVDSDFIYLGSKLYQSSFDIRKIPDLTEAAKIPTISITCGSRVNSEVLIIDPAYHMLYFPASIPVGGLISTNMVQNYIYNGLPVNSSITAMYTKLKINSLKYFDNKNIDIKVVDTDSLNMADNLKHIIKQHYKIRSIEKPSYVCSLFGEKRSFVSEIYKTEENFLSYTIGMDGKGVSDITISSNRKTETDDDSYFNKDFILNLLRSSNIIVTDKLTKDINERYSPINYNSKNLKIIVEKEEVPGKVLDYDNVISMQLTFNKGKFLKNILGDGKQRRLINSKGN